ncbi:hypothetical protein B5S29_g4245 [[Candida] boidinii]|nr:hypothetical protein B5S29_g4245 [[Candida] boidinii]
MSLFKRDYYVEKLGLWCVADKGSELYAADKKISQATVNYYDQPYYARVTIYLLVVIIFVTILKRLAYYVIDYFDKKSATQKKNPRDEYKTYVFDIFSRLSGVNRYISYKKLPYKYTRILGLPNSIGVLLIVVAVILYVLCFCFIPHFWYRECRGFGSPPIGVRSGLMATALVPFIFVLSGKQNIISTLTGISYEKLNIFHQWASILCFILGWIHTIPFYIQSGREDNLAYMERTNQFFYNGIPPIIFLTFLCIFSLYAVRKYFYEFFVQFHWICAIGFYIGLCIHVAQELGSQKYMIATFVLWVSQVLFRIVYNSYLHPKRAFKKFNATFTKFNGSEAMEVVIHNTGGVMKWQPGQHLFVREVSNRILDNHPFSILSYHDNNAEESGNDVKLIVKPMKGLTNVWYKKLLASEDGQFSGNLLIDGPFGGVDRDVASFNSLFLFASGTGITAIISFINQVCELKKTNQSSLLLSRVEMHWCIREMSDIAWISKELALISEKYRDILKEDEKFLKINIYCCSKDQQQQEYIYKEAKQVEDATSSSDSFERTSNRELPRFVELIDFKPDIRNIVKEIKLQEKNMIVLSGGDLFKEQVSNSVARRQVSAINGKISEIYLHTENFSW